MGGAKHAPLHVPFAPSRDPMVKQSFGEAAIHLLLFKILHVAFAAHNVVSSRLRKLIANFYCDNLNLPPAQIHPSVLPNLFLSTT